MAKKKVKKSKPTTVATPVLILTACTVAVLLSPTYSIGSAFAKYMVLLVLAGGTFVAATPYLLSVGNKPLALLSSLVGAAVLVFGLWHSFTLASYRYRSNFGDSLIWVSVLEVLFVLVLFTWLVQNLRPKSA